eukprot:7215906-Ditylum_brightwellii.AAC.2
MELNTPNTSNGAGFILHTVKTCLHTTMVSYQEFLDINFDVTHKNLSIIGQIFAAELSNKNYTLKEMMQ